MRTVTLGEILTERATGIGGQPTIIYKDEPITHAELDNRVNRFAHALMDQGVGREDKVATMLNNCHEFIVSFFACAHLGSVAVPVNIFHKERELDYLLWDSEVVAPVTNPSFAEFYTRIENEPPGFKWLIVNGEYPQGLKFSEVEEGTSGEAVDMGVEEENVAEILYTSVTTGEPKGVMLTHGNLFFHSDAIIAVL